VLTELQIQNLKVPAARREIAAGKPSGLYLVLQPSGARSWALRYRIDGEPRKFTIGPYPTIGLAAARRRAQEALGEIAKGSDPAAVKRASKAAAKAAQAAEGHTVENVAASFLDRYVRRHVGASWAGETERLFKVEINPKLGGKPLDAVKRSDVHDLLDGIVDRGSPILANRTLAVLRRYFNWSIERGIIAASPCDKIKAPAPEQSRDRVLSDDEIRNAWRAFERVGWPFGKIAQLLLLTGARRDEIGSGRWSEIDLEAKTWTIAKERSKNGLAHEIPLSDAAIDILESLPRIGEKKDAFIFTTTGATAVSGFSRAKEAIDAAMRSEASVEHWTLHDLRRTAASGMAGIGIAPHVVEAVLGHKSGTIKGVSAVYNRYSYSTEKREALDRWSGKLAAIVGGEATSNVVELAQARA
jgi:integrase